MTANHTAKHHERIANTWGRYVYTRVGMAVFAGPRTIRPSASQLPRRRCATTNEHQVRKERSRQKPYRSTTGPTHPQQKDQTVQWTSVYVMKLSGCFDSSGDLTTVGSLYNNKSNKYIYIYIKASVNCCFLFSTITRV